jgi:hypothetical protein
MNSNWLVLEPLFGVSTPISGLTGESDVERQRPRKEDLAVVQLARLPVRSFPTGTRAESIAAPHDAREATGRPE